MSIHLTRRRSDHSIHCTTRRTCCHCRRLVRVRTDVRVRVQAAYVSIRQHPSASVSICQHPSAYVNIRHTCRCSLHAARGTCSANLTRMTTCGRRECQSAYVSIRQHTSAYVSICQHTSAYASIHQHTSASVSIRQLKSAYVSIRVPRGRGEYQSGRPLDPMTPTKAGCKAAPTYIYVYYIYTYIYIYNIYIRIYIHIYIYIRISQI